MNIILTLPEAVSEEPDYLKMFPVYSTSFIGPTEKNTEARKRENQYCW